MERLTLIAAPMVDQVQTAAQTAARGRSAVQMVPSMPTVVLTAEEVCEAFRKN